MDELNLCASCREAIRVACESQGAIEFRACFVCAVAVAEAEKPIAETYAGLAPLPDGDSHA